eukprot:GSMAST32.ASY1.ANO1.1077.1 assembled CDS
MFHLALKLDPDNELAASNIRNMSGVMGEGPDAEIEPNHSETFDVIIVGAGASGVGVALSLTKIFGLDPTRVLLVERGKAVGETFRRWPKEMRFISPSFNQQGWTSSFDLNSVAYGTSPAYTLGAEHPTGIQYARYLSALADEANLNMRTLTEVTAVRPFADGVDVTAAKGALGLPETLRSRYVIWAAGEFQYPTSSIPLRSWTQLPGNDFVIIGGFESGMDAASNLALNGKRCTVVSSTPHWNVQDDERFHFDFFFLKFFFF